MEISASNSREIEIQQSDSSEDKDFESESFAIQISVAHPPKVGSEPTEKSEYKVFFLFLNTRNSPYITRQTNVYARRDKNNHMYNFVVSEEEIRQF